MTTCAATPCNIRLSENLKVPVASLVDLVRVAGASTENHDRAHVPALLPTLELATTSGAGDAAASGTITVSG